MLKWNVSLFNKNGNVYCCWIVSDSPHVNAEWIASCRRSDYATVLRDTVFNIYRNLYPFGHISFYFFSSQVLKLSMFSFPCWSFSSYLSWLLSCSFVWRSKFQPFHLIHIMVLELVAEVVPVSVPWGLISLLFLDTKKWAHLQDLINYTFKRLLNRPQVTTRLEKLF